MTTSNTFLSSFAFFFEVIGRGDHGVVERGAAARFDLLQTFRHLGDVGGEILVEVVLIVKVDDENFVLGLLAFTRLMAA